MEPRDPLAGRLAGVRCSACGGTVGADGIRALAIRDDLAFVELACRACGTRAIGLVADPSDDLCRPRLDLDTYGEFGPLDEVRLAFGRPVDAADVLSMHALLARWRGDLRGLLGETTDGPGAAP
ncbi:MAG TPA: hypothetical protein VIV06_11765 [Candidatus Limnocylindrales bacterium]